ncbi:hypothetical protein KHA90_24550 [Flavobacterium psychroterrae]|uniref:DUF2382 domain-containing protein n=1 Tax=Flavobacterium psychroterrae TaxID=2133767 RepID=A0ABS5PJ73_9FLAO|nr:hypothetical protein [Flavobacterium psychroterrae]MBS7234176.1 hypothetical protein [Flavobacterium psychroterrae]
MKKHEIFETNPDLKSVHVTSDGTPFYNDNDAKMHAKTLKDKSVELIVNPLQIEVIDEDVDDNEFEDLNKLQHGDAIPGAMIEVPAIPDGSVNILAEGETGGDIISNLPELSAEETEELIASGGEAINITGEAVETANIETAKEETPKNNTKKVK